MEKRSNSLFLILIILIAFLTSCNQNRVYSKMQDMENAAWDQSNILNYSFTVQDTVHAHNLYFNVRHSSKYNYQNLYLFIETTSPEGYSLKDTFEIMLADEKGRWYGKGWGDLHEVKTPYKKNVRFPHSGTYTIEIQQAMRTKKLQHITDFGVQIEKVKK